MRIRTLILTSLALASAACMDPATPLRYGPALVPPAMDAPFRHTPPGLAPIVEAADEVWQTTLPNGLSIVHVPRHDMPLVTSVLVVQRGALDLGDAGPSADEVVSLFRNGGIGADDSPEMKAAARDGASFQLRATPDSVWAESRAPREAFAATLRRLAGDAAMAHLSAAEYRRRGGEWRRLVASKQASTGLAGVRVLFGGHHAYGLPHGPPGIAMADAQAIHDRLFRPAQCTLVVVGDVSREQVVLEATRALGSWVAGDTIARVTAHPPAGQEGLRVSLILRPNVEQQYALVFARGPDPESDDVAALSLAANIGGGAVSSKLWDELRDQGYSYTSGAGLQESRVATWVSVGGAFAHNRLFEGTRSILASLAALRDGKVTDEDVALAQTVVLSNWRQGLSTDYGAALYYAGRVSRGRPVVDDFPARISRVTREDVIRVARTYLAESALHLTILGNNETIDVTPMGLGGAVRLDL